MVHRSVLSSAIVLGVLALTEPALAQQRRSPPAGEKLQTPEVLPPAEGSGATGGSGPATDVPEKKAPSTPAAGYAYTDKPRASRASTHTRYRTRGPVVNLPGFEQTPEGGSRLFVQLTQTVPVEERKAQSSITYVLKGASPRVWNNTNALVTVHFNTPVARARLVPQGQDLHLFVELRAAATPTWKITEAADKSAILTIDFPKGDFLQIGETTPAAGTGEQEPKAQPAPAAVRGKRGGRKPAPPPKKETPAPSKP